MPFTFTHPALVLPFISIPQRFVSVTGLVVGSMIPDFEYFLRLKIKSEVSHTLGGVFVFDLPVGILACLIFQVLVRESIVANLPAQIQIKVPQPRQHWVSYFMKYWPAVVLSIVIGALSHLLWDGFTHRHGFAVDYFGGLVATSNIFDCDVPRFKILQHLSSVFGCLAIVVFIARRPKHKDSIAAPSLIYWIWVLAWALGVLAVKVIVGGQIPIGDLIATLIAGIFLGLILTPLCLKFFTAHNL